MNYYAGIDVSLKESCVCVVDERGKVIREAKIASEPDVVIAWFSQLGLAMTLIGLEAGPLSQWLFAAMKQAGLAVELLETRHVRKAFEAMGPRDALEELICVNRFAFPTGPVGPLVATV